MASFVQVDGGVKGKRKEKGDEGVATVQIVDLSCARELRNVLPVWFQLGLKLGLGLDSETIGFF